MAAGDCCLAWRSRSRTASSMASSSKGFIDCLSPVRSRAEFLMRGLSFEKKKR
jgi:hypothetical protein